MFTHFFSGAFLVIPNIWSAFLNSVDNLISRFHGSAYRSHSRLVMATSTPVISNVSLGVQGSFESAILLFNQFSCTRMFCNSLHLVATQITLYNKQTLLPHCIPIFIDLHVSIPAKTLLENHTWSPFSATADHLLKLLNFKLLLVLSKPVPFILWEPNFLWQDISSDVF